MEINKKGEKSMCAMSVNEITKLAVSVLAFQ